MLRIICDECREESFDTADVHIAHTIPPGWAQVTRTPVPIPSVPKYKFDLSLPPPPPGVETAVFIPGFRPLALGPRCAEKRLAGLKFSPASSDFGLGI